MSGVSRQTDAATRSLASPDWPFAMGPPVWGCEHWGGVVYPSGTRRSDYLHWYSRTFNAVECNSIFYGLPSRDTVKKWIEQTVDGFEFCLKFPRSISHDAMLLHCDDELSRFMEIVELLGAADRLGPSFLQLGPSFGPERFESLSRFLESLSPDYPWAVEVRHPGWFDCESEDAPPHTDHEQRLDEKLRQLGIDRVLFDSRALFSRDPEDEIEKISQSKKPNPPHRETVTSDRPMIRMVGRNRVELARPFVQSWVPTIHDWLRRGLKPIIFTHAPDDRCAPAFARLWLQELSGSGDQIFDLPTLPPTKHQPMLFE